MKLAQLYRKNVMKYGPIVAGTAVTMISILYLFGQYDGDTFIMLIALTTIIVSTAMLFNE